VSIGEFMADAKEITESLHGVTNQIVDLLVDYPKPLQKIMIDDANRKLKLGLLNDSFPSVLEFEDNEDRIEREARESQRKLIERSLVRLVCKAEMTMDRVNSFFDDKGLTPSVKESDWVTLNQLLEDGIDLSF